MFGLELLTINIAFELFGLFFCFVCICISAFSPAGTGIHAESANDIRNLFLCDAVVMFSDAAAGIFRGKDDLLATVAVNLGNFVQFAANYILFGLMITLMTHMIPSDKGQKYRRIAWGFVIAESLLLLLNLYSKKIYYIDENNYYHRGELFPLTQLVGVVCVVIAVIYTLKNRKNTRRRVLLLFLTFALLCITALVIQIFSYGIACLNIAVLIGLMILFIYNQMFLAESLAENQKLVAEKELALEQSRTQLIISQIKPHFLFNTLTSIAQLCDDSPQTAKETTIAFASYLRKNMHSLDEQNPIPFADELAHIKCYLKIEQVRFGEYLNIEYDIGPTEFDVPCLTVQPLIENAVKHGVGQKDIGGTVRLSTEETDSAYIVTVKDDGVGFDPDAPRESKSLGLRNIESRLRQLSNADLSIQSEINVGTTAVITIPKQSKE